MYFSPTQFKKKSFVYFHKSCLIYLAYATLIHCQENCIMERYHYLPPQIQLPSPNSESKHAGSRE